MHHSTSQELFCYICMKKSCLIRYLQHESISIFNLGLNFFSVKNDHVAGNGPKATISIQKAHIRDGMKAAYESCIFFFSLQMMRCQSNWYFFKP